MKVMSQTLVLFNTDEEDGYGYIDTKLNIVKVKEYFSPSWMATYYMTHLN